jgi:cytochrome c oxidase subunit 3
MSQSVEADGAAADHGHGHAGHSKYLAHHFDTLQQQFDAGKLGVWLFLATEILFFSGLFCAYAVYRANHPEIFIYAHQFLNTKLGGINTAVLIFSSLTMAWGVRCAQLNQKQGLVLCLTLTILCAFGFMGIKYVEYKHKWEDGLLWGKFYKPVHHETAHTAATPAPAAPASATAASLAPTGLAKPATAPAHAVIVAEPQNVRIFFSIYFCMTGLHALHILIGIGLLSWLLLRALKGEFNSENFAAVDFVGLYWHVVDLIWIFLFPLLYLIR